MKSPATAQTTARERVPADVPPGAGPGQQLGWLGAALHRHAGREGHQVNERGAAAGMRPVHDHYPVTAAGSPASEQQVVGPDVGVQQGVARRVAAQVASSAASSARRARDHGSRRSSPGVLARARQPLKSAPRSSATAGARAVTVAGAGVRASASRSSAASTRSSS